VATTPSATGSMTFPPDLEVGLDPVWRTTQNPVDGRIRPLGGERRRQPADVNFSIARFFGKPNTAWLDSAFYELHDK
jgi:hypothetical protein